MNEKNSLSVALGKHKAITSHYSIITFAGYPMVFALPKHGAITKIKSKFSSREHEAMVGGES